MLRVLVGAAAACIVLVAACIWLLPERYAVNFPMGSLLGDVAPPEPSEFERRIRLPDGFAVSIFAQGIRNARFLRFTPNADLLVTSPEQGAVFLLERDDDGDGAADGIVRLVGGLERPHGLDLREGWLYVAETGRVLRVPFDAEGRAARGPPEVVVPNLPQGGQHWTRTIRFGPDGGLYVSVGSSCNVCIEEDRRRAAILRYPPDGGEPEVFASGLRNAVGFDWRPGTGDLYATDNGRDFLGDDRPPCELNRVERGGFYGWPHANGFGEADPDLGAGYEERIRRSVPPVHGFQAHVAPLGITFYRGRAFPEAYRGAAFVALHGSWNRTRKVGYKVVVLRFGPDGSIVEEDFVAGFEVEEDVIGRPVDVAEGPDGALYVSDDYAGAVYRVTYTGSG